MMPAKPNTWTYQHLSYLIVSDALLHKDASKINHLNLSRSSRCFAARFLRWRLWCNQLLANIVSWDSVKVTTASQMLCWMVATNSDIHQSNLANPLLISSIMASPMLCCMISTKSIINHQIHAILIRFIIMASQMLCCMISTQSKIYQLRLRIMASQMLCCMNSTKSEINQ